MNARLSLFALLSAAVLPLAAHAADSTEIKVIVNAPPAAEYVTVEQLARETGLSERQVRMVVGARTSYADYRYTFDRTQRRFREALGADRYRDLIAGRPIPRYRQGDGVDGARILVAEADAD